MSVMDRLLCSLNPRFILGHGCRRESIKLLLKKVEARRVVNVRSHRCLDVFEPAAGHSFTSFHLFQRFRVQPEKYLIECLQWCEKWLRRVSAFPYCLLFCVAFLLSRLRCCCFDHLAEVKATIHLIQLRIYPLDLLVKDLFQFVELLLQLPVVALNFHAHVTHLIILPKQLVAIVVQP